MILINYFFLCRLYNNIDLILKNIELLLSEINISNTSHNDIILSMNTLELFKIIIDSGKNINHVIQIKKKMILDLQQSLNENIK